MLPLGMLRGPVLLGTSTEHLSRKQHGTVGLPLPFILRILEGSTGSLQRVQGIRDLEEGLRTRKAGKGVDLVAGTLDDP